jgi:hypothetical protein
MGPDVQKPNLKNDAFISYSRRDRGFAWEEKGLNLPQRNYVIFRNEENFSELKIKKLPIG